MEAVMKALTISDYSFAYPGGASLLNSVSLELPKGSFTLLVGATGSGKTTLLRAIKPELAPVGVSSGRIEVFDRDVTTLDTVQSSSLVGYVSQNPDNQIVCDTVWHELAFGLENLGTDLEVMRRRVAEIAHFFGMESWLHQATNSLSGGQKQALNLASVLVMQPRLLLLDEPTAQLDPVAEKNFLHALFRVNRELGITILVATHAPETMLAYATNSIVLDEKGLNEASLSEFVYEAKAYGSGINGSRDCVVGEGFESASDTGAHKQASECVINLKDAYFRFTRETEWVLRGMDLKLYEGQIHALVGGNGAGKTTILRVIAGILKLQRGKVHNSQVKSQVLLPQDPKALFVCDTVEEELAEWEQRCGYQEKDIEKSLQNFALYEQRSQHPYDLSGGQQQMLALAKLLLIKPQLLLLDEPTKGLDALAKRAVAEMLCAIRDSGATIILATHDLAFASCVADRATMVFDGEATCTELIGEFFNNNIFYRPEPNAFLALWKQR